MFARGYSEFFYSDSDYIEKVNISIQRPPFQGTDVISPVCHWHERTEIIAVNEGEVFVICEDSIFVLKVGDILFVNPFEIHFCRSRAPETEFYCVIADLSLLSPSPVAEAIMSGQIKFPNIMRDEMLFSQIKKLSIGAYTKTSESQSVAASLNEIITRINTISTEKTRKRAVPADDRRMTNVLTFIHQNYEKRLSLSQLAAVSGFVSEVFCRKFKQSIGMPPMDYINFLRVNKAYELLINTNERISIIASRVGFPDANYFSRQFKNYLGITPTQARKLRCLNSEHND